MTGTWRRRLLGGLSALLMGAGAGLAGSSAAEAAPRTGQVYVVQGLVGTAVDIDIDGKVVARDARAKDIVGPLKLAAGQHVVTLRDGDSTVATAKFSVAAGASIDVVAHLTADADREPQIMVFRNNLQPVGPGKTRLVVSHTAVAPPADIRIDGRPFFRNVAPGESLSLVVPARTYSVDVVPSSGGARILPPVDLTVKAGTLTRVFAIGDPSAGTADAIVQVLTVAVSGSGRPSSVPTGDGGQAADEILGPGAGARTPVMAAAAGLGLGAVMLVGVRRTSSARGLLRGRLLRSRHAR